MRQRIGIAALVASSLVIAACGSDEMTAEGASRSQPEGKAAGAAGAPQNAGGETAKKPTVVGVQSSQYGDVLFDRKGFVLYLFTKDTGKKSRCYGECAEAWPPYTKKGPLKAGDGVDAGALATSERKDGSAQVTYHGHPLYYYEHDDEPGEILCHDVTEFGGDWLVVQPDGQPAP